MAGASATGHPGPVSHPSFPRGGFTLVEFVVAFGIFSILSVGVYFMLSDAGLKRSRVEAGTLAQKEMNLILSHLQQDLSQARDGTFATLNLAWPRFGITLPDQFATVTYLIQPPRLVRQTTATGHQAQMTLSEHVQSLTLTRPGNPGQILVAVDLAVPVPGQPANQAQRLKQTKLITLRADNSQVFAKNWVDSGGMVTAQETTDTKAQNADAEANSVPDAPNIDVGALAAQGQAAIEEKFQEICAKLRELCDNLDTIDTSVSNLPNQRLIYNPETDILKEHPAGGVVKGMFMAVDSWSQWRPWNDYHAVAQQYGNEGLSSNFQGFFDSKRTIFENGRNLIDSLKQPPFNKTVAEIRSAVGASFYDRFQ